MEPLHRDEAIERSRLLRVTGYDVELDLTRGDETYGSVSRVRFESTTPGASTFLNFKPARDASVSLNGRELPADAFADGRVRLDGLEAENELVAAGEMAYSHTGEGMHRFVDPADGEAYTWAETGLYYGGLVYGQFDQPDLKAPLRLSVTAQDRWTVVDNAAGERGADGTRRFVETTPISTYLMTVVAGPYHEAHAQHGEIPLGLYVRRSLAEHLDADELFEVTRGCFDYYHRTFGIPYPFGKYDQAFVPELFLGAMENPGCVKFTDQFIYRSRVTDDERALRAFVVAHEMAHMWFGNLVTMRWWDDLWLNESFAEYIGHDATDRGTRFTSAWTYFSSTTKSWGYRQDELPSSHPVSTEVLDTDMALLNLDGISYAKGAGTLKQLVAWVGRDAFLSGLRDYFGRHAWANTTLTDLLDALEPVSGRDLHAWSREWLQRPGVNVLRPEITADGDRYERVAVLQSAPPERPTLRSHRVGIGLYHRDGERLVRRERVEVDISGARTEVPELAGTAVPDLLLLNDDDLTWAKIRLDDRSLATLRDGGLTRLAD